MTTKVRRRASATKTRFWWFQGSSVRELYDRLGAANPDTARLEVHIAGDKMTLEIFRQGGEATTRPNPPINDSRVCPPICP